jgi:hypothetical protein
MRSNGTKLLLRPIASAMVLVVLVGCGAAGLTQFQDSVTKFNQGANSVSTAESSFFKAVRNVDCTNQFYARAYNQARGSGNVDISSACAPSILTDEQIKTRQSLMDR